MSLIDRILGRENRAAQPFADAIVDAIIRSGSGTTSADPQALGALEVSAGLWARAFASAEISPRGPLTEALTPFHLALLGRELCRRGEAVLLISVSPEGRVNFSPAGSWDITGSYDPAGWVYRLDLFGPSGNVTRLSEGPGVIHARYAVDPATPWKGRSPLEYARDTGNLGSYLEKRLGEEASGAVGSLIPIPADGGDNSDSDVLKGLKSDIGSSKGKTLLVETTAAGWGEGRGASPNQDWRPVRFGANPPESLGKLRSDVSMMIFSACGVPPELAAVAQGTASREAWRRFLHGTIQPVSRLLETELSEKLELPVTLNFDSLMASDISGRARAFQSMVGGGMDLEKAATLAGLLIDDEES